jgi:hypothetical protein
LETIESFTLKLRIFTWGLTNMANERHRISKEIAQELKEKMGDGAYLYCLEKLSNNTEQPKLWRDVLSWLDESNDLADAGSQTKGESKC